VHRHLTRRTSLAELDKLYGAVARLPPDERADRWWAVFTAEVEACLAGGGELWEWEFAGNYGVAVVRDATSVREWPLAICE
jgi:hypothetical protein